MDIFEAARTNNIGELQIELQLENPNVFDARGFTPLIIAAYYNHTEAALALLDAGANTEFEDSMGNTALMGASFKGYKEVVEILLQNGANVNYLNGNQASALTFAATFGHHDVVELLLSHGGDPLLKDRFNKNPIDYAMIQENDKCYEILVASLAGKSASL